MSYINIADIKITNFIFSVIPHNLFINYFFSFFSLRGSSIFIWLIVIAIVLILEELKNPGVQKRDIKFILVFLLTFTLSYLTSDLFLKNIFRRPRPVSTNFNQFKLILTSCPSDYSFPSTHATTAFASAAVLTAFDKKRKWLYFIVAILISLSRIYLGCHYFFDVVSGGVIGWLIAKVILGSVATPESILDKPE